MKFGSYKSFLKHGIIENHIQPKTCTVCSKIYSSSLAKMEHDKKCHEGGENNCKFCGGTFIVRKNLLRHKKLQHSAYNFDEGKPQKCPICPYNAPNFKQFLKHMREQHENKRFYCYICKKSDRNGLKTHMRTVHAEEMPFCCEVCQMKFSCYKSFLKHGVIEKHIQSKTCTICSKTYSSNLSKILKTCPNFLFWTWWNL